MRMDGWNEILTFWFSEFCILKLLVIFFPSGKFCLLHKLKLSCFTFIRHDLFWLLLTYQIFSFRCDFKCLLFSLSGFYQGPEVKSYFGENAANFIWKPIRKYDMQNKYYFTGKFWCQKYFIFCLHLHCLCQNIQKMMSNWKWIQILSNFRAVVSW